MSSEFDEFEELPRRRDVPILRPEEAEPREDYRDPPPLPRKPGFGFWLAVAWTLLYFVATQIVLAIVFGIPILILAILLDPQNDGGLPQDVNAWMKGPVGGTAMLCLVGATQFGGLALSLLLLRLWCGKPWKRKIALTRLPSPTHAILMLIGFPAMIAVAALVEIPIREFIPSMKDILDSIGIHLDLEGSTEAILAMVKDAPWMLAIFVVAVSPGICEEFFCRGFLAQGLAGRYQTWAVVLIVSFLFGCLHADPQQGVGAMMLGAIIHGAYVATRSLLVAMLVHFANNGLAVVHVNSHLYPVLDPLEQVMKDSPILFVASSVLLFAAVCYALYQTRCKLVPIEPGMPVWQPKGISGVELPPPGSGTVVSHDPISPLSVALVLAGAVAFGMVLAFA